MSDDTERLDWLEANPWCLHGRSRDVPAKTVEIAPQGQMAPWIARRPPYTWAAPTLREAIDFARGSLTAPYKVEYRGNNIELDKSWPDR